MESFPLTSDSFPPDDLLASRGDAQLQQENSAEVSTTRAARAGSTSCPACGASGGALSWFYFSSPPWTWQKLCGRAGVVAFCDRDQSQVASFITMLN